MKYIYISLYYAGRGLRSTVSLDERFETKRARIDFVMQEDDYPDYIPEVSRNKTNRFGICSQEQLLNLF